MQHKFGYSIQYKNKSAQCSFSADTTAQFIIWTHTVPFSGAALPAQHEEAIQIVSLNITH